MTINKFAFPIALPIVGMTLAITFCAGPRPAHAQTSQQDSIVEAARKAREQQKKDQKPAKIYTNEDISQLKGDVSVVGPAPEATPADKAATAAKSSGTPEETANAEASWRSKFAAARRTLADDSRELDILQREFNLKQQQFYSDPNVALREQYSRKDLDDTQAQIDAKKADVEKDRQAISDLQDALRKAGGDPGWANDNTGSNGGPNTGSSNSNTDGSNTGSPNPAKL